MKSDYYTSFTNDTYNTNSLSMDFNLIKLKIKRLQNMSNDIVDKYDQNLQCEIDVISKKLSNCKYIERDQISTYDLINDKNQDDSNVSNGNNYNVSPIRIPKPIYSTEEYEKVLRKYQIDQLVNCNKTSNENQNSFRQSLQSPDYRKIKSNIQMYRNQSQHLFKYSDNYQTPTQIEPYKKRKISSNSLSLKSKISNIKLTENEIESKKSQISNHIDYNTKVKYLEDKIAKVKSIPMKHKENINNNTDIGNAIDCNTNKNNNCESYTPISTQQCEEDIIDIILKSAKDNNTENGPILVNEFMNSQENQDASIIRIHDELKSNQNALNTNSNNSKSEYVSIGDDYNTDKLKTLNTVSDLNEIKNQKLSNMTLIPSHINELTIEGQSKHTIVNIPNHHQIIPVAKIKAIRKTVMFTDIKNELIIYKEDNKATSFEVFSNEGKKILEHIKVSSEHKIIHNKNKAKLILRKAIHRNSKNFELKSNKFHDTISPKGTISPNQSALQGLQNLLDECDSYRSLKKELSTIEDINIVKRNKSNNLTIIKETNVEHSHKSSTDYDKLCMNSFNVKQQPNDDKFLLKQLNIIEKIKEKRHNSLNKMQDKKRILIKSRLNSKIKTRKTAISFNGLSTEYLENNINDEPIMTIEGVLVKKRCEKKTCKKQHK